jgi:flagellar hook-associated protein 1 FlgK
MSGIFSTINIGLSGLLAQRRAIDVHAHNIANAGSEGYRRQEALITANPSLPAAGNLNALVGGQWGQGVQALSVIHSHESYLDLQARITGAALGQWTSAADVLHQVEVVLQPAPGEDLGAQLDRFWNAWEEVAVRPEDMGARYALCQQAAALTDAFHDASLRLGSLRTSTDVAIVTRVEEINALGAEVAELNRVIAVALAEGRMPNDDLDRRDVLLDRIAGLTGAMPFTSEKGDLIVYVDGRPLVQGQSFFALSAVSTAGGMEIRTSYDDTAMTITQGEIGGLLYARDACLPTYLEALDALAEAVVTEVNAAHRAGYGLDDSTGQDFLLAAGTSAGTMEVNPGLLADPRGIAAAGAAGSPGDGSVATQIANLRFAGVLSGRTYGEFAAALLGRVGGDVRVADVTIASCRAAREQIRLQQQSVSGVVTDEEIAYLTQCQRAYEAAARVIQVADEMLRLVIERMGVS